MPPCARRDGGARARRDYGRSFHVDSCSRQAAREAAKRVRHGRAMLRATSSKTGRPAHRRRLNQARLLSNRRGEVCRPGMARSHLAKSMRECAAYHQGLRTSLELDHRAASQIPGGRGDVSDVDDGAAVDLPEALRIELIAQFAQRRADQGLAVGSEDAGVFVVGLEIADVVDADQPYLIAD